MSVKERSLANIEIQNVYQEAFARYQSGYETYGCFNPIEDKRDLIEELIDELKDQMNYAAMQIIKLRVLRTKISTTKYTKDDKGSGSQR